MEVRTGVWNEIAKIRDMILLRYWCGMSTHLLNVQRRVPVVVALQMEVPHADLAKVAGMELVKIGPVVML